MNHEFYMKEALDLARKGWPRVSPNPMVGCVIVYKDTIVARGYHEVFGGPHAEVNAIHALPGEIPVADCLLYVSLEPCSHHGKTPPCADLIVSKGFKNVVVASLDPNPLVAGRGLKRLRDAGIVVTEGVMAEEAEQLNKHFMTFHRLKRPYIILKWAITSDGFISRLPLPTVREHNTITGQKAKELVHRLRAEVLGILVGKNTVLADDPLLTTRLVEGRNPVRLVIDRNLEIPRHFKIYQAGAKTVVFNAIKEAVEENIHFVKLDFHSNLVQELLRRLADMNIQSLLVEGGAQTLQAFLEEGAWDEALVFQNPDLEFKSGIKGPVFVLKNGFELVGNDKLFHHFQIEEPGLQAVGSKEIF